MQAGYYCSVCDCILRDSQSYLDHINGKWHNRALGMSMRVERSTADEVRPWCSLVQVCSLTGPCMLTCKVAMQVRQTLDKLKSDKDAPKPTDHVADGARVQTAWAGARQPYRRLSHGLPCRV